MLEKLRKSLFLLIVLLLGICGAGAFYVSRASAESAVQAATVSLQLQPAEREIPASYEITETTMLRVGIAVRNTGTVPVYLEDTLILRKDGLPLADASLIRAVRETGGAAAEPLAPGESRTVYYNISFPGAALLPEGSFSLTGEYSAEAYTEATGQYGFRSGPYSAEIPGYTDTYALMIPVRSREIRLYAEYISGSSYSAEYWYFTKEALGAGGDALQWTAFDAGQPLLIQADTPLLVYYELTGTAGTVRSDLYRLFIQNGIVQKEQYDYFTGQKTG